MRRAIGFALALALTASPVWAGGSHHGRRGHGGHGGSHGGGHSSGATHRSHGGTHGVHSGAVAHGSRHHGHGRGLLGALFDGRHYHGHSSYYYGYPPYYGYNSYRYYDTYGYPYYSDSYGYSPTYGRRSEGMVRVIVEPRAASVYVDGSYVGNADDFDGRFQSLHLAPGRHEIVLSLGGYRSAHFEIEASPGHTIKLHHQMAREAAGEGAAVGYGGEIDGPRHFARGGAADGAAPGALALDVSPPDAVVYVDGEFRGPARDARQLDLPPGRHRVEIVRPGRRTFEREVEIRSRATARLQVDMEP